MKDMKENDGLYNSGDRIATWMFYVSFVLLCVLRLLLLVIIHNFW
jgi:hypothetical protein